MTSVDLLVWIGRWRRRRHRRLAEPDTLYAGALVEARAVRVGDDARWLLLIPNEELITGRVEDRPRSQNLLRLRKLVGVHYKSDVHKARELCLEAADETERILKEPKPVCLMKDFGASSVDLELLTRVWDRFHQHGIEISYPQRDLHLRSSSIGLIGDARV